MIARWVEKILCYLWPSYFEVHFCYGDVTKNMIEHFSTYEDALKRVKECVDVANTTGLSLWVIDKYINIRPHFLVKVSRWHKGEYIEIVK